MCWEMQPLSERTKAIIGNHKKCGDAVYNLLGKGTAYSDIRNVTSSLSHEAAEEFLEEYGNDITEEEVKADAFTAPLITLFFAYRRETFPAWAKASLEELKNGDILKRLKEWLCLEQ